MGLHARGLFENGFIAEGERAAGRALTISFETVNATVATLHGFYKTSRFREGHRILRELDHTFEHADDGMPLTALLPELRYLRGVHSIEPAKVLVATAEFDDRLSIQEDDFFFSSSLLWRLKLVGVDDEYYAAVAQATAQKSSWLPKFPFSRGGDGGDGEPANVTTLTDRFRILLPVSGDGVVETLHPVLNVLKVAALIGAGESARAHEFTNELRRASEQAATPAPPEAAVPDGGAPLVMGSALLHAQEALREVAVPLCDALLVLARGDFAEAAALLLELRPKFGLLGGDEMQQDMLDQTLLVAVLQAAQVPVANEVTDEVAPYEGDDPSVLYHLWLARALVNERCSRRSLSPQTWEWHSRVHHRLGKKAIADVSALRALDLGLRQGGKDAN